MDKRTPYAVTTLLLIVLLNAGCALLAPEEEIVEPGAPIILMSEARSLAGTEVDDLTVQATTTRERVVLDTGLVRSVAERSKQAVISIYIKSTVPHRVRLVPFVKVKLTGHGLGSGFFIHPMGYVLTNDHVIRNADEIYGLTRDGQDLALTVVARDPAYDLALLKVENTNRLFPALPMGDSDHVGVGDWVIAVGNPLGLGHTVTLGIISQTGRNLTGIASQGFREVEYIQTDSAINPGSSGGPLITLSGAWIGVNTAAIIEAQNIGFTVPSSHVIEFLERVSAGEGEWQD
jgi:S1-C subfamily serine protease